VSSGKLRNYFTRLFTSDFWSDVTRVLPVRSCSFRPEHTLTRAYSYNRLSVCIALELIKHFHPFEDLCHSSIEKLVC
jgi:hypothetical protein